MTKTATKEPALTMEQELEALRAKLAATQAERDELSAKLAAKAVTRAPAVFPAEHLAPEGSSLRYIQDKVRGDVYDAGAKLLRQIPVQDAFQSIHDWAAAIAKTKGEGATVQSVMDVAMTRTPRKPSEPKTEKKVGDATETPAAE